MNQLDLFDAPTTQQRELTRCTVGPIGTAVLAFVESHAGEQFHMSDLHSYVIQHTQCAPGSPDRVFRELRRQGAISVELVSRSASLYQVKESR